MELRADLLQKGLCGRCANIHRQERHSFIVNISGGEWHLCPYLVCMQYVGTRVIGVAYRQVLVLLNSETSCILQENSEENFNRPSP